MADAADNYKASLLDVHRDDDHAGGRPAHRGAMDSTTPHVTSSGNLEATAHIQRSISTEVGNSPTQQRRHTCTLTTNAIALFIGESSRGLFIASLFVYITALQASAESDASNAADATRTLGLAVSCFSWGRLIASFLLPFAIERGHSYRSLLQYTFLLQILGHLVYMIPAGSGSVSSSDAVVIVSRTLVGVGSGTLSMCRAVVAEITTTEDRMAQMAWLSFAKYAGYALCPGLSIILASIGGGLGAGFGMSEFTAPAWLSIAMCCLGMALVQAYFRPDVKPRAIAAAAPRDVPSTTDTLLGGSSRAESGGVYWRSLERRVRSMAAGGTDTLCGWYTSSSASVRLLMQATVLFTMLNFATKGALAVAEATLAPQFADTFGTSGDPDGDIGQDTAEFTLGLGVLGLVAYVMMAYKPKPQQMSAAASAAAAVPVASAGTSAATSPRSSIDDQPAPTKRALKAVGDACRAAYARAASASAELDVWLAVAMLLLTSIGMSLMAPYQGSPPPLARLSFGLVLVWSVAAPVLDVLTVSCFSVLHSKVNGSGSGQARYMGYLSAAGAVGRITFPAMIAAFSLAGVLIASAVVSALCAVVTVCFFIVHPDAIGANNSFDRLRQQLLGAATPHPLAATGSHSRRLDAATTSDVSIAITSTKNSATSLAAPADAENSQGAVRPTQQLP